MKTSDHTGLSSRPVFPDLLPNRVDSWISYTSYHFLNFEHRNQHYLPSSSCCGF
jgi:hypothetical protein